jgi:P27 family predicted phage terminase small subunit
MRGRRPKPTSLKRLEGNPGKRALNDSEPRPRIVLPRPPAHLSDEEKEKWKSIVRELHPLGLVTVLDLDQLSIYCVLWMRWVKAERMVREKGEIIKTAAGNIIQNPYLSIANRTLDQLNKLGAEFGMTPSARSRVKAEPPDAEHELEQLLFGQRVTIAND